MFTAPATALFMICRTFGTAGTVWRLDNRVIHYRLAIWDNSTLGEMENTSGLRVAEMN